MIRNTQLHIILLTSPTSQQWRNTVGGLLRGQVSAPVFLLPGQKGHNGQNPLHILLRRNIQKICLLSKKILYNNLA